MLGLRELGAGWLAKGRPAVVVEVAASQGSVPREAGTRMLVAADEVLGSIGGGHLELQAITDARRLLAEGGPGFEQRIALGPTLGQCCGGALVLRFSPLSAKSLAAWPAVAERLFLQIYGAGHVGRAIVALLCGLNCRVRWIDEREAEFPAGPLPSHIEVVLAEPVLAEVDTAPPGAYFLVLTHSHELDLALTQAILRRGDFAWFGLIGSRTKRARFEHRLLERGFDAALVQRICCPIGLPGISGKEPEVVALAVVAQLLQLTSPQQRRV